MPTRLPISSKPAQVLLMSELHRSESALDPNLFQYHQVHIECLRRLQQQLLWCLRRESTGI
jgi:hypothetical protein